MRYDFDLNNFCELTQGKDKLAIVGTDRSFTWAVLYEEHLRLKELLECLPKDKPVIIYGEKEGVFPVAMITLINLNIVYVPVDTIMPVERVKKIIEITEAEVVINCSQKTCPVETNFVVNDSFVLVKGDKRIKSETKQSASDPVRYILFTSGSTGEPKGVQITKEALNDFIKWYVTWPEINTNCIYMNQAPFSFDISLCDFVGAFYYGATIVLNNYSILKNANSFLQRLKEFSANTMVCTPSFIYMYLSSPEFNTQNYPALNHFIFIGEELPSASVKKLKRLFPVSKIINSYGPTEATVVVTYVEITNEILTIYPQALPIGYMKPGTDMLVINESNNSEEPGELVIVGDDVSIGYLKNKEKNEQVFYTVNKKRAYRTGDLGYVKNKMVFFLGRNDNQVKLNGYRIELDEISEVLLREDNITHAATVPLKQGNTVKKIVSFITSSNENVNTEDLKIRMTKFLPSYMIPSEIIVMKEIPLNSNYKTDKKALIDHYLNL